MPLIHRPWRGAAVAAATALMGILALAGCASPTGSGSTSLEPQQAGGAPPADQKPAAKGGAAVPDNAAPAPAAAQGEAANAGSADGGGQAAAPVEAQQRSLIYTGTITVKVDSVSTIADQAIAKIVGMGGFVAGDNRTIDADRSQAVLTLRVPADRFTAALDAVAALGTEESRRVQAQDVTDTLVDLDARVATQEASVNRVRDLLARAQTIGEIVSLESELTRRQADLDSLKQRREKLGSLVALATVTAVLLAPGAPGVSGEPDTGFLAGLRSGWDGFLASVKIMLTVAGWLLPWAVTVGVPLWLIIWAARRRRRARRAAATPAVPPGPPAPAAAETTA